MLYRHYSPIPERMVALSLLPPPNRFQPPAPYGYGALVVTWRGRGEAEFSSHAHGYGARYDPQRMRRDIGRLFTPETKALIHAPAPSHAPMYKLARMPFPSDYLDYVPRSGLADNIHAIVPYDQLMHSARIGGLELSGPTPSAIHRIVRIRTEAQAAWIFWLLASCSPRIRRNLLASYSAWRALERAIRRQLII